MLKSLIRPDREIETFRKGLSGAISAALDLTSYADFTRRTVPGAREVSHCLTCPADEILVIDDKGTEQSVVEIASGRGWRAMIGVSAAWMPETGNKSRYSGSQLIVFLAPEGPGPPDQATLRQFMRLEWEPLDRDGNFEGEIAHPHWQVDLAGFQMDRVAENFDGAIIESLELTPQPPDLSWSSKLHLAAAARWMTESWGDDRPTPHVCGPQTLDELTNWLAAACRYVRLQVAAALTD